MNEQIKQIAMRLRGLREVLEFSIEEAASICQTTAERYEAYESGTVDIPVSVLHSIANAYNIELAALLTGDEPHVHNYTITRKGKGKQTERHIAYHYEALATSFIHKKGQPFIVTVSAKPENAPLSFNAHIGQEFNIILKGRMEIHFETKTIVLNTGDSIYFDSAQQHAMRALDNKECKFLAFIL